MRAKFIYEDIKDILKPKEESDIKNVFKQHGITEDEISIRVRKPLADYNKLRMNRCLTYCNVEANNYIGEVPKEENENDFIKISGKPWNVFNFIRIYYGRYDCPDVMDLLKRIIINN